MRACHAASASELNRLVSAIDELTNRIHDLERESSAARRRVNELEHELDACKDEVIHERSRMTMAARKGKGRLDVPPSEDRYRDAVEQKNGTYFNSFHFCN